MVMGTVMEATDTATAARPNRAPILALLLGSTVSQVGNSLTAVAVPWFVLQTTGSAARTGLVAAAGTLPIFLAGVFGGPLVDRLGYRRASIAADLASGVTVAAIPALHYTVGLAFWQLLLVFLGALLDAPGNTARMSLLPDLARLAGMALERANGVTQVIHSLSQLVGPLLAGLLIVALGPSNVLWIDAATFAVSAALIALAVPAAKQAEAEARTAGRYLAELRAGFGFVRRQRLIASLLVTFAAINFLIGPLFTVLLPVYADRTFGSAVDLGVMLGGFGLGALVGAALYGAVGPRLPRRATFIAAFIGAGLPFWALASTPPLLPTIAALFAVGLAAGPINPLAMTLLQERTPEGLRGRVMGMTMAIATAAMPFGMLAAGIALETVGLTGTLVAIAAGTLLVTLSLLVNPYMSEMDALPAATEGAIAPADPAPTGRLNPSGER